MENAFYFMLKALFILNIITFLSLLFGHIRKRLDKKARLILKFITLQTGQQIISIHILPKVSINKENETMKFGQLPKYYLRNIFFSNIIQKMRQEDNFDTSFSFLKCFI